MSLTLPTAITPNDWQEGPADAPVTLLEYGDFQCGDCREAHYILKPLRARFAGRLRFVYRHLPLTDEHPQALAAARASEAAGSQGKFWEMHDALIEGPQTLTMDDFQQAAARIGLNPDDFDAAIQDEATYKAVRADVDGIRTTGIQSTPTFFLNNVRYEGVVTATTLTAAIEALLPAPAP